MTPVALQRGLDMQPDIIVIDGGSTDSGPAYLGRGVSKYSRASTKVEMARVNDRTGQSGRAFGDWIRRKHAVQIRLWIGCWRLPAKLLTSWDSK